MYIRNKQAVHIGDRDGKIAVWLNEQGAFDFLNAFRSDDLFVVELGKAIEIAYPEKRDEDNAR